MTTEILMWTNSNPGAMAFLGNLTRSEHSDTVIPILKKSSIRGTDLYVLWSDLCGKDLHKVEKLVTSCPLPILEDACSRQDYSGRELIKDYL